MWAGAGTGEELLCGEEAPPGPPGEAATGRKRGIPGLVVSGGCQVA